MRQVNRRGLLCHRSTIAKIEAGQRAVQVEELVVFADIFGVTVDKLCGRSRAGELASAVSNLSSNAQRMAGEIALLHGRLSGERDDVREAAIRGGAAVDNVLDRTFHALGALAVAQDRLNKLAGQFPIPT